MHSRRSKVAEDKEVYEIEDGQEYDFILRHVNCFYLFATVSLFST